MKSAPGPSDAKGVRGSLARRLLLVVLLGVVVYGVLVVLRGTDSIRAELEAYRAWTFAAACGLSLVNYLVRFVKWEYYLAILGVQPRFLAAPRAIPLGESFLVFLSGFVLTVTPGKVGEVFKSLVLRDLRGIPVAETAPIVVAERLTDLVGIILLISIGGSVFPGGLFWAALGTAFVAGILLFVGVRPLSRALLAPLSRLPGAAGRAAPKIERALDDLRALTSARALLLPSVLSVGGWALEGVGVWLILRGFATALDVPRAIFFYATATLAGALVPVPGGLGVTEKVLEESMVALGGVPGPVATATMLLSRLATLWFAVLVGFLALAALRVRHPSVLATRPED